MSRTIIQLDDKQFELYINHSTIDQKVAEIAAQIKQNIKQGEEPLFIAVLNGVFMFASDLLKHFEFDCEISFVKIRSYVGLVSKGETNTMIGLETDLKNRKVIILEDIVDTGNTMAQLVNDIQNRQAKSVDIACLLLKPEALQHKELPITYVGMEIPDKFVVGYGMDYNGLGRNFKDIYQII